MLFGRGAVDFYLPDMALRLRLAHLARAAPFLVTARW